MLSLATARQSGEEQADAMNNLAPQNNKSSCFWGAGENSIRVTSDCMLFLLVATSRKVRHRYGNSFLWGPKFLGKTSILPIVHRRCPPMGIAARRHQLEKERASKGCPPRCLYVLRQMDR